MKWRLVALQQPSCYTSAGTGHAPAPYLHRIQKRSPQPMLQGDEGHPASFLHIEPRAPLESLAIRMPRVNVAFNAVLGSLQWH